MIRRTRVAAGAGFWMAVAVVVVASLAPFLWFVATSLKTPREVAAIPPVLVPGGSLEFYRSAVQEYDLFHYLGNSCLVAGGTTLLTVSLSVLAGYAVARLPLPGKRWWLGTLLLASMFPQISVAGPVWRLLHAVGGLNTYPGLILPYVALTLPLGVWIMTAFFRELPRDLEDAARVDGWGPLQILLRVALPLAAPGVFTASILVFIYAWNEFFFALLIMTERAYQTLPVGIALFQGEYTLPWGEIAAASTIATLPLVALVLLCQRWIIRGLSAGAVRG